MTLRNVLIVIIAGLWCGAMGALSSWLQYRLEARRRGR